MSQKTDKTRIYLQEMIKLSKGFKKLSYKKLKDEFDKISKLSEK